jgi:hypothetical protein
MVSGCATLGHYWKFGLSGGFLFAVFLGWQYLWVTTTRIAGFTACPAPVFTACLYIDLLIHLASFWIGVGDFACNGLFSPASNSLSLQLFSIEMRDVYRYLIKVMSSLYLQGMTVDFLALCLSKSHHVALHSRQIALACNCVSLHELISYRRRHRPEPSQLLG